MGTSWLLIKFKRSKENKTEFQEKKYILATLKPWVMTMKWDQKHKGKFCLGVRET